METEDSQSLCTENKLNNAVSQIIKSIIKSNYPSYIGIRKNNKPGSRVDVQTRWLSQFPPALQQTSFSNSSFVQSRIPCPSHVSFALEWVEPPGHLTMVVQVDPSSEQQRTPAPKSSGWNVPRKSSSFLPFRR